MVDQSHEGHCFYIEGIFLKLPVVVNNYFKFNLILKNYGKAIGVIKRYVTVNSFLWHYS